MLVLATNNKHYNLEHLRSIEILSPEVDEQNSQVTSSATAYVESLFTVQAYFGESSEPVILAYSESQEKAMAIRHRIFNELGGVLDLGVDGPAPSQNSAVALAK